MTLTEIFERLVGETSRPVVVHSALWPIARALRLPPAEATNHVLDALIHAIGPQRTLIHPTFTSGYKDGFINLDTAPTYTGVLGEAILARSGAQRTLSAFFSFAALGPDADEIGALRPAEPWGQDSVFSWIEEHDAHLVMLGISVMNCSFPHRIEWLLRSIIPYREPKTFDGTIQWRGQNHPCRETLLARKLNPPILNTFKPLEAPLAASGLQTIELGGSQVAEIGAATVVDVVLPLVKQTPDLLVQYLDDAQGSP